MNKPGLRSGIEAVAIGASAGGLHALLDLLSGLPASFSLPVVAVLHLPDSRQSELVNIFSYRLALTVREAGEKHGLEPGTLYLAGPGYHLLVEMDRTFSLSCEAPLNYSRPSIDVLMASAADAYGPALAGVLLTGANADGAEGLARIGELGGLTVVQDPAQAEAPTMPLAAIGRRPPDFVLPLKGIHELLMKLGQP